MKNMVIFYKYVLTNGGKVISMATNTMCKQYTNRFGDVYVLIIKKLSW